jgi:hypothetical protein
MGTAITIFMLLLVTVCVASTFLFLVALSKRLERSRGAWGAPRSSMVCSADDGGLSPSSDTWGFSSWLAGSETPDSLHNVSGHHGDSCSVSDSGASGSWDSGGGGDCGGGGDGGGGGDI